MKYKITCPHCGKSKTSENYTEAMCAIPHSTNCEYRKGLLPTKMIQEIIQ